ncbi:MAG TPA: amidohydrolase family protein [Longimicrobiaceae bacterium]|nr:amidohydrolase family protein [Longimicrobiaceae bacterium]
MLRPLLVLPLLAAAIPIPRHPQPPTAYAIEHVTVLPMDGRDSLPDQTVLVRGQAIERVGPAASVPVPPDARRIDGRGLYLMPGMADMHVHPYDRDGLSSYLAHGVTTIAVMHGFPEVIEWREAVRRGELAGPSIYTAGPSVNGYPPGNVLFVAVEDTAEARAVVREQHAAGYDFVKVYSMLNPPEYTAILDEARRLHMPVFGHIPWSVAWKGAIEQGQPAIAHVEEFFNAGIQDSSFAEAARLAKEHGTAVTANLYAYGEMLAESWNVPRLLGDPEMRFHSPAGLSEKLPGNNRALRQGQADFDGYLVRQLPRMRRLVKMLHDAGVPIFGGTDTETFGFPGASLLGELHELEMAGLTPYQALESVTRLPGEFIHRGVPGAEPFGTVAEGSRADLVLLAANPLRSLANLRTLRGTFARGRWYPAAALGRMRDSIAARNARVHPLVMRLDSLVQAGNAGGAADLLEQIHREFPDVSPVAEPVLIGWGRTLYLRGDKPNAIRLRLLSEELFPRSFSAPNQVGRGYLFAGDTSTALVHFRRSLAMSPHNSNVRRTIGRVEDARRSPAFAPGGRWDFEPVTMRVHGQPVEQRLSLAVADSAGHWRGRLRVGDRDLPLDDLVIGGHRVWASVDVFDDTLELMLVEERGTLAGTWTLGWGNNGPIRGRRVP